MPKSKSTKAATDRNAEFLVHLKSYDDWASYDSAKFPQGIPFQFPINLGTIKVASVYMDWREVCIKVLGSTLSTTKRPSESDVDFWNRITALFDNASPVARSAYLGQIYGMVFHIFEYLPQQFTEAFLQLMAEGYYQGISSLVNRSSRKVRLQTRAAFADEMTKRQRAKILSRLPRSKPHTTKTKPKWKDEAVLKAYAETVNRRKLLAETIKRTYDAANGDDEWLQDLHQNNDYQLLKTGVASAALNWAIKQVALPIAKRQREPLTLACEMARLEMSLDMQQPQTLRNYYSKGVRLTKKRR